MKFSIVEKLDLSRSKSDLTVYVAYVGGTMGMKADEAGSLAPVKGYLTEQLRILSELQSGHLPKFDITEYDPLLDSSDMGPEDWAMIAKDIESKYYEYDGFMVICGTDTMAYCASALSFMLENLGKTVIVTGSAIPFAHAYNDARRNFIVSLLLAAVADIPEVCVFFNDALMRGNRTKKMEATSFSAFHSPNHPVLAHLGVDVTINRGIVAPQPKGRLRVHTDFETNIVVLRLIPGFDDEVIETMLRHPGLKGVVFEFYGTGNAPGKKGRFLSAIVEAIKSGVIVCAASQCPVGTVSLDKYAVGGKLSAAGVISAGDMTTEAVVTKLAYLLKKGLAYDEVARAMTVNLRGELTEFKGNPLLGAIGRSKL